MKTLYKVLENGKLANYGNIGNDVAKVIDSKDLNHDLWIVEENGTIQVWKRPQSNKLSQGIIRCEMVEEKKGTIKATGETIQICVMAFDLYTVDFELDTKSVKTKSVEKSETTKSETTESTLYEATSPFLSKADVRNLVLDNRDIYEGYIIRSLNNWDSDTIYRWEEKDNGKIIWRKEKA